MSLLSRNGHLLSIPNAEAILSPILKSSRKFPLNSSQHHSFNVFLTGNIEVYDGNFFLACSYKASGKYRIYPPNNSSAPSPERTTFTLFEASSASFHKPNAEKDFTG